MLNSDAEDLVPLPVTLKKQNTELKPVVNPKQVVPSGGDVVKKQIVV
jgi:hypothetical protein